MLIETFPLTVNQKAAQTLALQKGGLLGRILFAGKKLQRIELHHIEFYVLTFEVTYAPDLLERLGFKKKKNQQQQIDMIVDGSTAEAAWIETMPDVIRQEVESSHVQSDVYAKADLMRKAETKALRILRRAAGGVAKLELKQERRIFRPYWMAFYCSGAYLPIPGDGQDFIRSY